MASPPQNRGRGVIAIVSGTPKIKSKRDRPRLNHVLFAAPHIPINAAGHNIPIAIQKPASDIRVRSHEFGPITVQISLVYSFHSPEILQRAGYVLSKAPAFRFRHATQLKRPVVDEGFSYPL